MSNNSIGQFIAILRKANGMTQQDVADRLNVSNKAVSRWERDESAPDISLIPALAEMFGVTCDELLRGERITEHAHEEKRDVKAEKQLNALINRAISNFKMMCWISIAVSIVGFIAWFGTSYAFARPDIGFPIMLLIEVVAVLLTAIATSRMKETKSDNEMFGNVDVAMQDKFNRVLGSYSFNAFFVTLSVVVLVTSFMLPILDK